MRDKKSVNRIIRKILRSTLVITLATCMMGPLSGCAGLSNTKIVFTTGFTDNELFRIEDLSCMKSEYMVYLINSQNTYETGFGSEVWNVNIGENDMENYVKDKCLSTIAQVKAMNLLAAESEITLTESEASNAASAAAEYYASLNDDEIRAMGGITEETLTAMYTEYATADKLYDYIIKDINPEISDDEARTITVEQIVLNTWKLDSKGEKTVFNDDERKSVKNKAAQILRQVRDGTEFSTLMEQYNEAEEGTVSIGKGDVEKEIENAAFNLDNGEVSSIIETEDSYVILKCISTFNREETEANKVRIVEEKKREVFGQKYDAFASTLSRVLNEDLYKKIHVTDEENVNTRTFFEVYKNHFSE
ncbi:MULTISPECIES: peptidylprolyl isomerase [unclassified Butyrivibrio]|uniref:peptidylprolyl isomerase n=1 Tax=unclassified Butyrivibrio TaxID=2639466 RepID=UPI0004279DDB|nr:MULTISPECIES: peptidylprolyl isomerase [unclassified Butyrivibrio]